MNAAAVSRCSDPPQTRRQPEQGASDNGNECSTIDHSIGASMNGDSGILRRQRSFSSAGVAICSWPTLMTRYRNGALEFRVLFSPDVDTWETGKRRLLLVECGLRNATVGDDPSGCSSLPGVDVEETNEVSLDYFVRAQ